MLEKIVSQGDGMCELRKRRSPIPITYKIISVIVIGVFIFWLISIVPIWIRTAQFGHEFTYHYRQTLFPPYGFPDRMRVMSYSDDVAVVYYSARRGPAGELPCGGLGVLITFTMVNDEWILYRWEVIWSASGSADGFIWPFIR